MEPNKFRAIAPILKEQTVKVEIGRRIIDVMVNRTLDGKDKNNKKFRKYSRAYKESAVFKIYKPGQNLVDLKLTGAMLAAIDVIKLTPTGFIIGFVDEDQRLKASGHVNGDNPNGMPIRDFFGVPNKTELEGIINDSIKEFNNATYDVQSSLLETIDTEVVEQYEEIL